MCKHMAPVKAGRTTSLPERQQSSGQVFAGSRGQMAAFLVLTLTLLVLPLVCMPWASSDDSASEKRELAAAPELVVDGAPNLSVLSDAGDYFADHFAFRSALIDVDATLKQKVFMTSSTDNVVVGTDGWLYYAGSLNDYRRRGSMSDGAIANAAHNLALIQEYVEGSGKSFALVIPPNKNTLYPEHMPYYELEGEGPTNRERLLDALEEAHVHVVEVEEALASGDEPRYFARDSHWNDEGALIAYRTIDAALGRHHATFEDDASEDVGHVGDVDLMLHPTSAKPELQTHKTSTDAFLYTTEAKSVEDSYIICQSEDAAAEGNLIMYRDSFGNNLLPPFATAYRQSVFTKLVPYDLSPSMIGFAEDVVVERTERHLAFFSTDPPYMPALQRQAVGDVPAAQGKAEVFLREEGPYVVLEGNVESNELTDDSSILVEPASGSGEGKAYECFRLSEPVGGSQSADSDAGEDDENGALTVRGDKGFRAYLLAEEAGDVAADDVRVLINTGSGCKELLR